MNFPLFSRSRSARVLFGALCLAVGASAATYDAQLPQLFLRTTDGVVRTFPQEQAANALSACRPSDAPLVIYVHGRGAGKEREPDKSINDVLPILFRDSGANVLMVYWPGSAVGGGAGFPETQARTCAAQLATVLAALAAEPLHRPVTLLTHSLGSFALEEMMRLNLAEKLPVGLIDNLLLSSAASEAKTHAAWLSKVHFAKRVFVTVNDHDPALKLAGMKNTAARLGKKLEPLFSRPFDLAGNVIYIRVDKGKELKHRFILSTGHKA